MERLPPLCRCVWLALVLVSFSPWAGAEQRTGDNCQLMLSQMQVDYGQSSRGQMLQRGQKGSQLPFGKREVVVSAICQKPVEIRVVVRGKGDVRTGFRFGREGYIGIQVKNVRLDGNGVKVQREGGSPEDELVLSPGDSLQAVSSGGQPLFGKVLTLRLELEGFIDGEATRVNEELRLEGTISLTLMTQ